MRAPGHTRGVILSSFTRRWQRVLRAAAVVVLVLTAGVSGTDHRSPAAVAAPDPVPRFIAAPAHTEDLQMDRSQRLQLLASRTDQRAAAAAAQSRLEAQAQAQTRQAQQAAATAAAKRTIARPRTREIRTTQRRASRSGSRAAGASAPPVAVSGDAAAAITFALAQVGKRYVWGTAGPSTYDCSGLVMAAFARTGLRLPHQSGELRGYGRAVPRGQWAPGDILLYPGHVAIYLGGGRMVHAANPRAGVLVAAVYGSPSARRLV